MLETKQHNGQVKKFMDLTPRAGAEASANASEHGPGLMPPVRDRRRCIILVPCGGLLLGFRWSHILPGPFS